MKTKASTKAKPAHARLDKKNLKLARKIISWAERYLSTGGGGKIIRRTDGQVWIFSSDYSHGFRKSGEGHWSRLYLTEYGIEYQEGYKWMPGGEQLFSTPEKLALLNKDYLRAFWENIQSRQVYKDISELNRD